MLLVVLLVDSTMLLVVLLEDTSVMDWISRERCRYPLWQYF